MQMERRTTNVALGAAVLLAVLVAAGCAGRQAHAAVASATSTPPAAAGATETAATATPPILTASPTMTVEPSAAPTAAATTAASPIPTPDLAAIDALIKDIKDELGAEASAGADEGSTP